jgi:hypothetical protein
MKKYILRKSLVLVVIWILILAIPVIPALNTLGNKNNEKEVNIQNNCQGPGLPDLKIVDVDWYWDPETFPKPGRFYLDVLNDGTAAVPDGWRTKTVKIFVMHSFLPRQFAYSYLSHSHSNHPPHEPGGYDTYYGRAPGLGPGIRVFRVYFWADCDNKIPELNETNNGVWAYYRFPRGGYPESYPCCENVYRLSPFYPWVTDGRSPLEIVENLENIENNQNS